MEQKIKEINLNKNWETLNGIKEYNRIPEWKRKQELGIEVINSNQHHYWSQFLCWTYKVTFAL